MPSSVVYSVQKKREQNHISNVKGSLFAGASDWKIYVPQTQTQVTNPPTKYSFTQLEQLWVNAGGDKFIAPVMAAIALAESGGSPGATGKNPNSTDRGLWQINSSHGYGNKSYNPQENAKEAVSIYRTQGLTAWTTFTKGTYLKYLPGKPSDKTNINNWLQKNPKVGSGAQPPSLVTKGIQAIPGAEDVLHPGRTVQHAAGAIEDPIASAITLGLKEAMYAFAILGGGMLILLGLFFIGVDVGLSAFNKASNHPAVKLAKRATPSKGSGAGPTVEDTSSSTLPGPEA